MLKKIISAVSSITISAVLVFNCASYNSENAAARFNLDLIEQQLNNSRYINLTRGNMLNFVVQSGDGTELDDYRAVLRNSAGQSAGVFVNSYYDVDNNTLGITDDFEWNVNMRTFGELIAPNKPLLVKDFTVETSPTSLRSTSSYEKYDENINVLFSCKYESSEYEQMHILSTLPNEETAFTIPANKAGIFVDSKWASREGEGYFHVGETKRQYFSKKDMIGKLRVISPKYPLSEICIGVEDTISSGSALTHGPEYQNTETEYVKWSMHLTEVFPSEYFPEFSSNGTFSWDGNVYDPRKDGKYTSCIVSVSSGACLTIAMPDRNGFIEFYVDKNTREFNADVGLQYKNNKKGKTTIWGFYNTGLYGGTEHAIYIEVPNIPKSGATVYNVPAGEYTLEFTDIPAGYINPGIITLDIAETTNLQKKAVTLKSAPAIALGDVNGSGTIDSSDASSILEFYARQSTGSTTLFTIEQEVAADVNNDLRVDASDASCILAYYSYISTGGTLPLKDYIKS